MISIYITNYVEKIWCQEFNLARALESVEFEAGSSLTRIGMEVGSLMLPVSLLLHINSHTWFQIKTSVVFFYLKAFKECISLTAINIPAGVENIKKSTFNGATALKYAEFEAGSSLQTIDYMVLSLMIHVPSFTQQMLIHGFILKLLLYFLFKGI